MTHEVSVRCSSCGAEYIAGTTLCAECMGTDLRAIDSPMPVPPVNASPIRHHAYRNFWVGTALVVIVGGYFLLRGGSSNSTNTTVPSSNSTNTTVPTVATSTDQTTFDEFRSLIPGWNFSSGDLAVAIVRRNRDEVIGIGNTTIPKLTGMVGEFRSVAASAPNDPIGDVMRSLANNYELKLSVYIAFVNAYKFNSTQAIEQATNLLQRAATEANQLSCDLLHAAQVPAASIPSGACGG